MPAAPSRARLRRTALLVAALASTSARAQGTDDEDEVLVRGRQAGGFVSRARVEDSPREITDAASLIEPLPGVHVRRLGADDSFATLSIRGSSSAQVAVFVAGVPLSGGADPTLDLATLPLWPGAQARVFRSFAPAALGRGSLGGTLVIDPPSPRAPERTEAWTAVGSFGARRLRIGDVRADRESGVRVASGLSVSRSDDDFEYLDRDASRAAGRDVFDTRRNAGHAAAAGLVSVAVPVRIGTGGDGALTMTTLAQARRQELPGAARFTTPFQQLDSSRLLSVLELTLPVSSAGSIGLRGWGRREGLALRDDPLGRLRLYSPASSDDAIVAAGGSVGWRGRPSEHSSLEVRVDGSGERFAPGSWVGLATPPGARRTNGGIALDASVHAFDRMTLAASARGDLWVDASDDGSSTTEHRPTGHVGVEIPVGPVILAAHGGFVARPPSFVERYGNRGAFIGDPALRPESALSADAGARLVRRFGPLRLQAEVSGFSTWADDLIVFVFVVPGRAKAMNIGRARLLGIESLVRATAFGFDARVSHTGLATSNESECRAELGACERPPLPGRPTTDFVADLAWSRGPIRLRYGIDVVAGMTASIGGDTIVPARAFHGAGVTLAVPTVRGLSLGLDVRNLFDLRAVDYRATSGTERLPVGDQFAYPLPGRRFLLSARWTLDR
jgi:hypothetical protein